jgi:predicted GNAT family N-acyltransferase
MSDGPAAASFTLVAASWERDRAALESVRRSVFVIEQGVPESDEWDERDAPSLHVLAVDAKRDAVGTGRLEPTGKIGRVAVLPQYRGTGVGSAIVGHLVNQATELGFTQVYLHAQTAALDFYQRLGFRAEGPEFDEVGIPHRRMRRGIGRKDEHERGTSGQPQHPDDPR